MALGDVDGDLLLFFHENQHMDILSVALRVADFRSFGEHGKTIEQTPRQTNACGMDIFNAFEESAAGGAADFGLTMNSG